MFTSYSLSCTLGGSVLGIGSGVARFLMTAEYATYRYLRCVVNVMLYSFNKTAKNEISLFFEIKFSVRLVKTEKDELVSCYFL